MIKRTLKNKIYELEKTIPKITIMHLVIAMQQNEGYARKDWKLYSWETRQSDAEARTLTLRFYFQSLKGLNAYRSLV